MNLPWLLWLQHIFLGIQARQLLEILCRRLMWLAFGIDGLDFTYTMILQQHYFEVSSSKGHRPWSRVSKGHCFERSSSDKNGAASRREQKVRGLKEDQDVSTLRRERQRQGTEAVPAARKETQILIRDVSPTMIYNSVREKQKYLD